MTEQPVPRLSVGLAVYNGERYLDEAIRSILSQTFDDFELIISDNASEDGTAEICHAYARRDPRIRYVRNEVNIGGANNENQTFLMSRGEYFRLAAHDDVCAPDLFRRCIQVLDDEPDVVLCYTHARVIDADGVQIGTAAHEHGVEDSPSARFASISSWGHDCEATYGVIRSDVMGRTELQRNYTDSDRSFLVELAMYGRFFVIDEPLFDKRVHAGASVQAFPNHRARMAWFGAEYAERITLPHWMQLFHYIEMIFRTPLSARERLRCLAHIPRWLRQDIRWLRMINDIRWAMVAVVGRGRQRIRRFLARLG